MGAMETDNLAELVAGKRSCLTELRDLGRRQLELIESGDMTGLLSLLAVKQKSLARLQRIERALDPFRQQDPESRVWRTPEDRQRCAGQAQQCEALLGEIVAQEKHAEGVLVRRRDEAAQRLQGAHFAGQARGAYQGGAAEPISQLDLTSES